MSKVECTYNIHRYIYMPHKKQNAGDDTDHVAEIKKLIESGEIDAISVDTTTFDDNGMRLDKGLFSQLTQFSHERVDLIFSEIVLKEIKKHLVESLSKIKARVSRDMSDSWELVGGDADELSRIKEKLSKLPEALALGEQQVENFIQEADALIVEATPYLDMSQLIDLYFNKKPPFHNENPKKSEFPDAIALASLEAWSIKEHRKILVVSRDGDWKSFCDQSNQLYLLNDLATALEIFQRRSYLVSDIAELLEQFSIDINDRTSRLGKEIASSIKFFDWDSHKRIIGASSPYLFKEEDIQVDELTSYSLMSGERAIKVTKMDAEYISVIFTLDVHLKFGLTVGFSEWDDGSKTEIPVGFSRIPISVNMDITVLVDIPIGYRHRNNDGLYIQLKPAPLNIGLGLIKPDFI